MLEHKDYLSSLNKARKKRNQRLDPRYLVLLLAAIAAVGIIVLGVKAVKKPVSGKAAGPAPTGQVGNATPAQAVRFWRRTGSGPTSPPAEWRATSATSTF